MIGSTCKMLFIMTIAKVKLSIGNYRHIQVYTGCLIHAHQAGKSRRQTVENENE